MRSILVSRDVASTRLLQTQRAEGSVQGALKAADERAPGAGDVLTVAVPAALVAVIG